MHTADRERSMTLSGASGSVQHTYTLVRWLEITGRSSGVRANYIKVVSESEELTQQVVLESEQLT